MLKILVLQVKGGKIVETVCNWKTAIKAVSPFMLTHNKWEWHMHIVFLKNKNASFSSNKTVILNHCWTLSVSVVYCLTSENCFSEEEKTRDRKSVIGSKQVPYIFLSKRLHCLLRGMDSNIKPAHLRCNSLLHWRKNGHFYCQGKENLKVSARQGDRANEREASARTKRCWRECWKEGEEDSSEWNCETIRYRFCHGDVTLTASCSSLCLSHVELLLMEPSYPGWTSVMKVYCSYWIWRWNLCLSHSCSLVFILQAQPSCGGHIYTHRVHSAVCSPAQWAYIAAHHCKHFCPRWIGLSTVHFCYILLFLHSQTNVGNLIMS